MRAESLGTMRAESSLCTAISLSPRFTGKKSQAYGGKEIRPGAQLVGKGALNSPALLQTLSSEPLNCPLNMQLSI